MPRCQTQRGEEKRREVEPETRERRAERDERLSREEVSRLEMVMELETGHGHTSTFCWCRFRACANRDPEGTGDEKHISLF